MPILSEGGKGDATCRTIKQIAVGFKFHGNTVDVTTEKSKN